MDQNFDPDAFIRRIGERLVAEFGDAKAGTTPSTVGSAAEQPVREQLEQVLPRGIAVGEGFAIDSYGGTSRQQDVILYERDICPVFSINNTPQTTYYPCEGVIAVGEIKSSLDGDSLRDAFEKIASVKRLRRSVVHDFMPHPTTGQPIPMRRNYLMQHDHGIIDLDEGVEATERERLEIFGFVLAGECRVKHETLLEHFRELAAEGGNTLSPNLLLTLDGCAVRWGKMAREKRKEVRRSEDGTYNPLIFEVGSGRWEATLSSETATHAVGSEVSEPFRKLVRWLRLWARVGRTSAVESFDRYFEPNSSGEPRPVVSLPKVDSRRKPRREAPGKE